MFTAGNDVRPGTNQNRARMVKVSVLCVAVITFGLILGAYLSPVLTDNKDEDKYLPQKMRPASRDPPPHPNPSSTPDLPSNPEVARPSPDVDPSTLRRPLFDGNKLVYQPIHEGQLFNVVSRTNEADIMADVRKIAVVRVSGTPEIAEVRRYLRKSFNTRLWELEEDAFVSDTPYGPKMFVNLIATLNPNANRYLVLTAHYDSKYFENEKFVGAIDSAVPCAILLDIARTLNDELKLIAKDWGIKIVFFDGEEAFKLWTPTDSLYGSRHLAQAWAKKDANGSSELKKIYLFVLLDLLGAKAVHTRIPSHFDSTLDHFKALKDIQNLLREQNMWRSDAEMLVDDWSFGGVQDDHVPFLERGVPILHLIPPRFPPQWHRITDDIEHLDINTVLDWATIMRLFVVRFFNLA